MGREDNVMIFQDTERMCKENMCLKTAIIQSISSQRLFLESDKLIKINKMKYDVPAHIIISKKRSYEAASAYKGQSVCIHNFASASNPGGGVTRGSTAQEECLCRCSSLYFCLNTPEVVALAAKNVIAEYKYAFKTMEFAVYCSPRDERNYKIFHRIISE